ncbi:hypothetical protein IF1G_02364 [Cordyceps javanica]|uniref:Uncharacterized protein n=1 Tax=Cordyceps javanica TaxID=43265 RepID=A0A545V983_9HYPO|nr:hypothetical protein IF1G_02364 [Cordyceps javanica]
MSQTTWVTNWGCGKKKEGGGGGASVTEADRVGKYLAKFTSTFRDGGRRRWDPPCWLGLGGRRYGKMDWGREPDSLTVHRGGRESKQAKKVEKPTTRGTLAWSDEVVMLVLACLATRC